jgi:hypothetical protein
MNFITFVLALHGHVKPRRPVIPGSGENSDAAVNRKKRGKFKSGSSVACPCDNLPHAVFLADYARIDVLQIQADAFGENASIQMTQGPEAHL